MKHLLLLFVLISFSCKKEDNTPAPEPKKGHLEIEYKTLDTEMTLYHRLNNESSVGIKDVTSNYYKLDTTVAGGINYACSLSPKNGGYLSSILIVFDGDTVKFQQGTDVVISGKLPIIP